MGVSQIRVQNGGPKSGSQIGVLNRGPKSGSQIGGPKSGSQIRGPKSGSQIDCVHFSKIFFSRNFSNKNNFLGNSREIREKKSKFKLGFLILLVFWLRKWDVQHWGFGSLFWNSLMHCLAERLVYVYRYFTGTDLPVNSNFFTTDLPVNGSRFTGKSVNFQWGKWQFLLLNYRLFFKTVI
jgi:hypothetical protein